MRSLTRMTKAGTTDTRLPVPSSGASALSGSLQRRLGNQAVRQLANREAAGPVDEVLRAPGQKLPSGLRESMEARFGHSFAGVRIHLDAQADASAAAVEAKAYTMGQHIVFGAGQYSRRSISGQGLLAHELAHVVQQGRGGIAPSQHAAGTIEAGARAAANAMTQGQGTIAVAGASGVGLARQPTEFGRQLSGEGLYPHRVNFPSFEAYAASDAASGPVFNEDGSVTAIVLKPYPDVTMAPQKPVPKQMAPKPKVKAPPKPDPPVSAEALRDIAEALTPKLIYPKPVRQFMGGVQFLGGGLEAGIGGVGGLATAETGVGLLAGGFLLAHGVDVAGSGWTTLLTGEESKTYTFMAGAGWAYAAGADPKLANAIGQSTDLIANIAAAGVSLRLPASPVIALSREAELDLELAQLSNLQARPRFGVDFDLRWQDISEGVLTADGYKLNPKLQTLDSVLNSSGKLGPKNFGGVYMYVVDEQGVIRIGTRAGEHMPHPTLIGGEDPFVLAAGEIDIRNGQIYSVNNLSGHFRPSPHSLGTMHNAFSQLPESAFKPNFLGFRVFYF